MQVCGLVLLSGLQSISATYLGTFGVSGIYTKTPYSCSSQVFMTLQEVEQMPGLLPVP